MPRRARLLVALVAAAALTAAAAVVLGGGSNPGPIEPPPPHFPAPPGPRAPRSPFLGLVSDDTFAAGSDYRSSNLGRQALLRVSVVRRTFDWAQIERAPGEYDLASYDDYVGALAKRGVEVLPVLFDPPPFRSSRPAKGAKRGTYPPRHDADMGRFAVALVKRYGPDGSFWRANPRLRRLPIRSWQIWNEPSLPVYWASGPDPAAYTRLLAATGSAIKRADPAADVVSAGLPQTRIGIPFERFLAGMYRAGARSRFDTMAVHPYANDAAGVVRALATARGLMDRHGDASSIWVTELGWASGGPPSTFTVGEQGQAARVAHTLDSLWQRRRELRLRGLVYFGWKDALPYAGGVDFWGLHTGLLTLGGRPKPAFFAFERAARRIDR